MASAIQLRRDMKPETTGMPLPPASGK